MAISMDFPGTPWNTQYIMLQEHHDQLRSPAIGVTWDGLYNGHHMGWTLPQQSGWIQFKLIIRKLSISVVTKRVALGFNKGKITFKAD